MLQSTAHVATGSGQRYAHQLCAHFAHRLPAAWGEAGGCIEFQAGTCWLEAIDGGLGLKLQASSETDLGRLEDVVSSHLARFAFREPLEVRWERV